MKELHGVQRAPLADNGSIHVFAERYLDLYQDPRTTERMVSDECSFPEECFRLGFTMDCCRSFCETYGEAALGAEPFAKIVQDITDIPFLACAIFSHWRGITHWSDYEYLLDDDHRRWFILALSRLAELTTVPSSPVRISLFSDLYHNFCDCYIDYDPRAEIKQRLTLRTDGRCWLTRRNACGSDGYPKHEYTRLTPEMTKQILDAVTHAVSLLPIPYIPPWMPYNEFGGELELQYASGFKRNISDSADLHLPSGEALSPFLRKCLGKKDLLLFHPLWDESSQEI